MSPVNSTQLDHVGFFFLSLFILRETETARVGAGQNEGKPTQAPHCQHRAQHGTQTHEIEIMTRVEAKSQMLNQLSHPGASDHMFLTLFIYLLTITASPLDYSIHLLLM